MSGDDPERVVRLLRQLRAELESKLKSLGTVEPLDLVNQIESLLRQEESRGEKRGELS